MSSSLSFFSQPAVSTALYLVLISFAALLVNRFLRTITNLLVKPAASPGRVAQLREQQTRTLAGVLYSAASLAVWIVALLTALDKVGVNPAPALLVAGICAIAFGFGAQGLVRDVITGFFVVLEDQYAVGDTVQIGETTGRVEHLTIRRTVVRDPRGALVTISNGEIRSVANLSRDWSQAFVDVAVAPELTLDKTLQALEAAATALRNDASWSQALVDGPRILGLQSFDRAASVIRLQVRTAPTRQDEVARELRRRIQIEFQRQGIPVSTVQRVELASVSSSPQETAQPQPLS
ncbi:MAG TPA: mechanosensitive ion channel family protein [Candidatus Dormibacteraeota bacterium]|nr:mechanosensitive ion channel family protein [Candidatus Dormibacteraeota bacterium]